MNRGIIPISLALLCAACRPDMNNQPKAKPLSQSDFFSDASNARQLPAHTVAYGAAQTNPAFDTGLINGTYITQLPLKLTPALLNQGRERFDAICAATEWWYNEDSRSPHHFMSIVCATPRSAISTTSSPTATA